MISAEKAIGLTLKCGVVYKFSAPELITTSIPHYFIVVAIEESNNYMCVCTTNALGRAERARAFNLHPDTIRCIEPTAENGLTERTFVDCNYYHTITHTGLIEKASAKKFEISGNLSNADFSSIINGVNLSDVNDIPKHLLSTT